MTTRIVPASQIQAGDTLRYLSPDPIVVTAVKEIEAQKRRWFVFEHATGSHRTSIFAHVHREDKQ